MPKIEPKNKTVHELRGLHLFHAGWSNCSMRVRMTLEEKALPWTSHHLDTREGEHITPEYFGINPNGLVPTLVHDGDVWIESCDIIRYLDDTWPEPRLVPAGDAVRAQISAWMQLAAAIHVSAVKTYMYCAGPGKRRGKTPAELERYRRLQSNEELLAFHTRQSSNEGLSREDRDSAERLLQQAFARLEAQLARQRWLAGDEFTLADITWLPLQFTLERAGFSFDRYADVEAWAAAIAARPSFEKAVLRWFAGPPGKDANASRN